MNIYDKIQEGQIWTHHTGKEYIVIGIANTANNNPKYPISVVFKSVVNNNLWTKEIDNFLEKMTLKSNA